MITYDNKSRIDHIIDQIEWQIKMGADDTIDEKPNNRINLIKDETSEDKDSMNEDYSKNEDKSNLHNQQNENNLSLENINNLRDLKNAINNFEGCDLKKTATQTVFSDGNPESKIVFVGEAPGAEEDRQGKPFVGKSGQLLDRMLAAINLSRQNVYITNIIPWRPPGNRTPTEEEVKMMKPFLIKHLELIDPEIIVAVGGSSAKGLMNISGGILRHRGKWGTIELNLEKKVNIIATLHPAYLLRAPNQKKLAWEDLKMIRDKFILIQNNQNL